MVTLLYGTTNPAKLSSMRKALKPLQIEILGLKDMGGEIPEVIEDGSTPLENARKKAHAYYEHYKIPVFSCDSGLYFEGLPEHLQPGIHVRTFFGSYFTDKEMLDYYSGLALQYGDIKARYYNAICLITDGEHIYESMDESLASNPFLITSKPYPYVREGFPLDSLSIDITSGKYYYELSDKKQEKITDADADELVGYDGFVDFFNKCVAIQPKRVIL